MCNWLNITKVSDGAHHVLGTLETGERWPGFPTITKRQAQASHLEGKRKDGSPQHNQLKQLVSYFFAFFVLWKLLPRIKCLKAYGPCVVRNLVATCHLRSGIRIYKCMFYTHTHTHNMHLAIYKVFYFSPPSPCSILLWNLYLFKLYPPCETVSSLPIFQHISRIALPQ